MDTLLHRFLIAQGVLNKNYKEWVTTQSATIIEAANKYSHKACGPFSKNWAGQHGLRE